MSDHRERAEKAARSLAIQSAVPLLLVPALLIGGMLLVAPEAQGTLDPADSILIVAAVATAALSIALSANLFFDALLFRVLASHDDEYTGCRAVDDLLARMRLKPRPDRTRSLIERVIGSRRLIGVQRLATATFVLVSAALPVALSHA